MPIEKRPDHDPERRGRHRHEELEHRHDRDEDDFFGLDVRNMSPRAQVTTSLAVLIPVVVGATLVLTFGLWWLIFVFGWAVFPAFGLLVRGIAGLSEGGGSKPLPGNDGERELLGALREQGELTPAQAAIETSLTVAEADAMLKGLAEGGHLEVRVRGGGLFYALWDHDAEARRREFENPL
ncbi:MAG: hypothetical protein ACR2JR_14920 [Rubrobacteraceae bacterium]